jgi:hypothetical protein
MHKEGSGVHNVGQPLRDGRLTLCSVVGEERVLLCADVDL